MPSPIGVKLRHRPRIGLRPLYSQRTDMPQRPTPPSACAGMTISRSRLAKRPQSFDAVVKQRPGFGV
jgi:hypothetical protein